MNKILMRDLADDCNESTSASFRQLTPKHFKHLIYLLFMVLWFGPLWLIVGILVTSLFYGPKQILPHVIFLTQNSFHEIHFGIDVLWKIYVEHRKNLSQ
jgi:hypothetical protein